MTEQTFDESTRPSELLRRFGLLESPPDAELSRVLSLATRLLDVTDASVFWESQRRHPVVSQGTDSANTTVPDELLRSVLDENEFVEILSGSSHERTEQPESQDFGVHAGVPLRLQGVPVGVLVVQDQRERTFDDGDRDDLELLAQQASDLLDRSSTPTGKPNKDERMSKNDDGVPAGIPWNLVKQAPVAFFRINEEGEFLQVNDQACEQLDFEREELLDKSLMDVDYSFTTKVDVREFLETLEPGEVRDFESLHTTRGRRQFPVRVRARRTQPDSKGELVAWVQDIASSRELQHKLHRTRERLRTIVETAPVGIVGIDPSDRVRVWNPAAEELFGWAEEEILGKTLSTVPEDRRREHKRLKDKAVQGESIRNFETKRLTRDGDEVDVLMSTSVVQELGDDNLVSLGYFQDISKLKQIQENLKQALDEKANLLREVHHRVKNNLQVVKSMLNLHERQLEDHPEEILDDCRDRIQTMAMIHDKLYRSEEFTDIPFEEYVEELVNHVLVLNNYPKSITNVDVHVESNLDLPLSHAFPCGLIIHELVSNACEHGFSPDRENNLVVEMKRLEGDVRLRVQDNGPGFPESFGSGDEESLGFEILRSLGVYELGGSLEVSSEPLTTVELTFTL